MYKYFTGGMSAFVALFAVALIALPSASKARTGFDGGYVGVDIFPAFTGYEVSSEAGGSTANDFHYMGADDARMPITANTITSGGSSDVDPSVFGGTLYGGYGQTYPARPGSSDAFYVGGEASFSIASIDEDEGLSSVWSPGALSITGNFNVSEDFTFDLVAVGGYVYQKDFLFYGRIGYTYSSGEAKAVLRTISGRLMAPTFETNGGATVALTDTANAAADFRLNLVDIADSTGDDATLLPTPAETADSVEWIYDDGTTVDALAQTDIRSSVSEDLTLHGLILGVGVEYILMPGVRLRLGYDFTTYGEVDDFNANFGLDGLQLRYVDDSAADLDSDNGLQNFVDPVFSVESTKHVLRFGVSYAF